MKRTLLFICLAMMAGSLAASAQNIDGFTTIDIKTAHPGANLTMSEAVYEGVGYARNGWSAWVDGNSYAYFNNGRWITGEAGVFDEEIMGRPKRSKDLPYEVVSEGGSLYLAVDGSRIPVAVSEAPGIVYGEAVSRNEFNINEGWYVSPSTDKIAFFRKDESAVTEFPLLDIATRTGELRNIRYPMNGMTSELVSIGIYDVKAGTTVYLKADDFTPERYLTNLAWSPDDRFVYVQVVDRSQHHMRLNQYRTSDGSFVKTLLTEDNEAWIEPYDAIAFLKGRADLFIYRTDNRDGYRNLYLCDTLGGVRRLTCVDADVSYLGNDGANVYYTSAEVSPVENHLFRIGVKVPKKLKLEKVKFAKPVRLTQERGWHDVKISADCKWFLDSWSNTSNPGASLVCSTDGKVRHTLVERTDPLEGYASCEVELGTVPSADPAFLNYYRLIKPSGFDPAKKYPLLVYVYGGPHSQMVRDSWLGEIRMWEMLMAQKGYVVYVQDNRGTSNRGAAFEKAINRQCGQAEMADQMEGIKRLLAQPWVDSERVGVHGWSYGGYMTISLMTTYPDVFKVGVAGGPVIDWKWYEIMYGERYMDNPSTNPEGFALTSLVDKAPLLKGRLLICQGAQDNTCVWEHSLSFVQSCIENSVQVDYFPYPLAKHNVMGEHRIHLMDKVTLYFDEHM
ncbi:MAG: DPP IV N-terminal domain-containing protein [Bacteroidales bacterium]|nr:DPP IV N-terminal domain-containing protein [Bacteroidales bacterium]